MASLNASGMHPCKRERHLPSLLARVVPDLMVTEGGVDLEVMILEAGPNRDNTCPPTC